MHGLTEQDRLTAIKACDEIRASIARMNAHLAIAKSLAEEWARHQAAMKREERP